MTTTTDRDHLLEVRHAGMADAADRLIVLLERHPDKVDRVLETAHEWRRTWVAKAGAEYPGGASPDDAGGQ